MDVLSLVRNMSYAELEVLRDCVDVKMQELDKEIDVQITMQVDIVNNELLSACAAAMLHQKWGINPESWRASHPNNPLAYFLAEHSQPKLTESEKIIYADIMSRFDLIKYIFEHTHYNYYSDGHYSKIN